MSTEFYDFNISRMAEMEYGQRLGNGEPLKVALR